MECKSVDGIRLDQNNGHRCAVVNTAMNFKIAGWLSKGHSAPWSQLTL
jgi:hypothetical protein